MYQRLRFWRSGQELPLNVKDVVSFTSQKRIRRYHSLLGISNILAVTRQKINVLLNLTHLQISELDFQDSVFVLGFSEELNKLLLQLYLDNRKEIRTILSELAPDLPSYHSLEWRLDVQVWIFFSPLDKE